MPLNIEEFGLNRPLIFRPPYLLIVDGRYFFRFLLFGPLSPTFVTKALMKYYSENVSYEGFSEMVTIDKD